MARSLIARFGKGPVHGASLSIRRPDEDAIANLDCKENMSSRWQWEAPTNSQICNSSVALTIGFARDRPLVIAKLTGIKRRRAIRMIARNGEFERQSLSNQDDF
jgi:hypothetical protein